MEIEAKNSEKDVICVYGYRRLFEFFFFNDTATTEIYTLSLHDALPISVDGMTGRVLEGFPISCGSKVSAIPVIFSENGKTALALVTEDNRFMSWTISKFDGKQFWTEENGRDRKSTRLNSSHIPLSRMPSSA